MTATQVSELEEWFRNAPRPDMPVFLNAAVQVTDYDLFPESHFIPLRSKPDAKINAPIILRLQQMKLIIESNS
ncbi:DUF6965 family protein [Pedobacter agri]|uniref:DUF6965 family protein n=1 Tax=Pedobacter agri TaxID=454586 RepID=UPI002783E5FB|nr:hypothetical protein [Pedobacter agri]MDQ1139431.1 hypothetical protein [Pedobacter agri]